MVGCSDKDVVVDNTAQNLEEFENGGYIGISLSLPSAEGNTTRANDDLSNGIEDEFAVNNATLYIFKAAAGKTEGEATFVDYVALGTKYEQDDQPGIDAEGRNGTTETPNSDEWGIQQPLIGTKITSTSLSEATRISNELAAQIKSDANNYFAYVVINHNGQIPTLTKDATTFQTFSRTLFSEIGADIAAEQNIYSTKGLLMTNAPICSVSGGSAAPVSPAYSTLVPITKTAITTSAATAKANPAACVYVERAAVKITVTNSTSSPTLDGYDVTINGWQVINNEEKYFNTRQINYKDTHSDPWVTEEWGSYINSKKTTGTNKYRFVSLYPFEPTLPSGLNGSYNHTTGYRTYFAADPHYDVDAVTGEESVLKNTVASESRPWIAVGKHAYTTENTFDVKHQTWQNTTMVTIKATLSKTTQESGQDPVTTTPSFYTVGKGSQTMYTSEDDVKAVIHNLVMNDPNVAAAVDNLLTLISKNNTEETVKAGLNVAFTVPTVATTGVAFTVTPAYTIGGAAATYNGPKDATITDTSSPLYNKTEADLKTALETAISDFLANSEKAKTVLLSYYKNGVSYYNVRIKHFGEAETPWDATDVVSGGSGVNVNEIYFNTLQNATVTEEKLATGQNNFLGRYGVVRDNWYKLDIEAITKIGSATPEDPSKTTPDTPDDEIENYISVHVHIVPWVLRSQSVIL